MNKLYRSTFHNVIFDKLPTNLQIMISKAILSQTQSLSLFLFHTLSVSVSLFLFFSIKQRPRQCNMIHKNDKSKFYALI